MMFINADAVMKEVEGKEFIIQYGKYNPYDGCVEIANRQPLVRCKDCKSMHIYEDDTWWCEELEREIIDPFWFCKEGEKEKRMSEYEHWCGNCQIKIYMQRHYGCVLTWENCPYTCEYATAMRCSTEARGEANE